MSTKTETQTSEFAAKAAKAAKERIRKAKIKTAENGETVTLVGFDSDSGAFEIGTVVGGGDYARDENAPQFATLDDAKNYLKTGETRRPGDAVQEAAAKVATSDQPAARAEPVGDFEPRSIFLYVFDGFAVTVSDVADAFGVEKPKARRALKKLESRGVVCSSDVNDEAQGDARKGQYGEVVFQSALGSSDDKTRDEAAAAYDELAAAERELRGSAPKSAAAPGARSQGRKLVHPPTGLIIRMSEKAQAASIAASGDLPVIDGVAFVRADGTKTADIVATGDDD